MTVNEMDFANYDLTEIAKDPRGIYSLSDGLIPEIAQAFDYNLGEGYPETQEISGLIGVVGQAKELQDNIGRVQERLGVDLGGLALASGWVERSASLGVLERSFTSPTREIPKSVERLATTGGVARWMLRRMATIEEIQGQGTKIRTKTVHLMTGNREMKETEHDYVGDLAKKLGKLPTESDFTKEILIPKIKKIGLRAVHSEIESDNGDEIFLEGIETNPIIRHSDQIVIIGNAPSTVMTTGQFYRQARSLYPDFNRWGNQLFMAGDSYDLAKTPDQAKNPAKYQNPYTALGQIARNGLLLHSAAQTMRPNGQKSDK